MTLATISSNVQTAHPDPLDIARQVTLPRDATLLAQAELLISHHMAATGDDLPWQVALHCLDQVRSERGLDESRSRIPIPTDLTPLACWLYEHDYDRSMIVLAIRDLKLSGRVKGSPFISLEDVAEVEAILDGIRGFSGVA